MTRVENDYRLGNIIDGWYGEAHVQRREDDIRFIAGLSRGTFGNFLTEYKPRFLIPKSELSETFKRNAAEWWWCYFYDNFRATHPHFANSLRDAVINAVEAGVLRDMRPSTPRTCVVHFRVGDFLNLNSVMSLDDMCGAVALFGDTPDRFEVLGGGRHFRADEMVLEASNATIRRLLNTLKTMYPAAEVVFVDSNNADDDFMRMVSAPMLLTGPGSFAIMAAAANTNKRLTPALRNMNFVHEGSIPPGHVYENWYTYPTKRSTAESSTSA